MPDLELDVLALAPAQLVQTLADGGDAAGAKFWREETENPDSCDLPCRLGLSGERREEKDEGNGEDAEPH
jgi:hypothetical protein